MCRSPNFVLPCSHPPSRSLSIVPEPVQDTKAELALAQKSLAVAQAELAHLHRLTTLGTLSAGLAHEMNNLLAPILGYTQLALQNPTDTALLLKSLTKAQDAAQQGVRVCGSVLSLSRSPEEDRLSNDSAQTSVASAAAATLDVLGWHEGRSDTAVNIHVEQGDVDVAMAPEALQQVLLNLFLNARQAMGSGGVVTVTARGDTKTQTAMIEVRDNGPGIPPAKADALFEPFVSLSHAAQRSPKRGTGLGLWICRALIQAAGGSIEIEAMDAEQQGACFAMHLPLAVQGLGRQAQAA